jgi:hypothetical protein
VRLAPVLSLAVVAAFAACSPAAPSISRSQEPKERAPSGVSGGTGSPLKLGDPAVSTAPPELDPALAKGEPPAPEAFTEAKAPAAPSSPSSPSSPSACNEQAPQAFLMRSNYVVKPGAPPEETERRQRIHNEALEYRIRRYGFIRGVGSPAWNPYPPVTYTEETKFFGIKIRLNKRIIPALQCVEEEIKRSCGKDVYAPQVLDGIRFKNTLYNGEVTNHAFGIAIDINPGENSCCGCLPPLSDWPTCKRPAASPFERTKIPRCWVDSFTKYGFYWLGYDPLEDTMHFEFLGDPDRILKSTASH